MFNSKKKQQLLEAKVDALYDELNKLAKTVSKIGIITQAAIRGLDSHTQSIIDLNHNMQLISEQQNKMVSEIMRNDKTKYPNHKSESIH
jgi:hypothetical protein